MTEDNRSGARPDNQNTAPNDTLQCSSKYSNALSKLLELVREHLYLPDEAPLLITLAATEANFIPGFSPCWLGVIGGSSSGKSEIVMSVTLHPGVLWASTISEAGLLSGSSAKDRQPDATGGILFKIPNPGVLVLKDFTSAMSASPESRLKVFAALREIYDGAWSRVLGTDGGKTLEWKGHLGLIVACTPAIDKQHATIGVLGERFLFVRMREVDPLTLALAAAKKRAGRSRSAELARAVAGFLANLGDVPPVVDGDEESYVARLAVLGVRMRSPTDRDSYTREIMLTPEPEGPPRMASALIALVAGLQKIGVRAERRRELLVRVVLDSMPVARRLAIEALLGSPAALQIDAIAKATRISPQATRRLLEDLCAFGVVQMSRDASNDAFAYSLSPWARRELEYLFGFRPSVATREPVP